MKTIGLIGGMSWESSIEYYRIINEEVKTRLGGLHSAKGIILGCTEIGLLVKEGACPVPIFDTTRIHAVAAVEYALRLDETCSPAEP